MLEKPIILGEQKARVHRRQNLIALFGATAVGACTFGLIRYGLRASTVEAAASAVAVGGSVYAIMKPNDYRRRFRRTNLLSLFVR